MMEDTVRDRYLKSKGKENENVMNTKIPGAVLMIILMLNYSKNVWMKS